MKKYDREPQIITQITIATLEVNYWPQESETGALEPPYPQEMKPQSVA